MAVVKEKKIFKSVYDSPLGDIHVLATDAGISRVGIGDAFLFSVSSSCIFSCKDDQLRFNRLFGLFDRYFSGEPVDFDIELDIVGTRFQKRVWSLLSGIPYGEVKTYGSVARGVGSVGGARAVGGACGANPLPIVIPCHRVVSSTGALGGFSQLAGGREVKKALLEIEGVDGFS